MSEKYIYGNLPQVSEKYMYWYNGVDIPPEFSMEPTFMVDNVTKLITESNIDLFCLVKQPDFYPPVQITWVFVVFILSMLKLIEHTSLNIK